MGGTKYKLYLLFGVESVILANFRLTDRVFYPNMIGKILVNLVQNRVMVSLLGSYDFVAWVKI